MTGASAAEAKLNRCPCGYYTDPSKECAGQPLAMQKSMLKISGPYSLRVRRELALRVRHGRARRPTSLRETLCVAQVDDFSTSRVVDLRVERPEGS